MLLLSVMGLTVQIHRWMETRYEIRAGEGEMPYLYGSRCQCAYAIVDKGTDAVAWKGWNAPEVWNLLEGGELRIPAYSLTAEPVSIGAGCRYRAEEIKCVHASKLAAIIQHSFPYLSLSELTEKVNEAMGNGAVSNLTEGEAICAAQQAIWKAWYADRFESEKRYVSIRGMEEFRESDYVYPMSLNHLEKETTRGNIENLYRYYLSFENEKQRDSDMRYGMKEKSDGSFAVTVMNESEKSDTKISILKFIPEGEGPVLIGYAPRARKEPLKLKNFREVTDMRPNQIAIHIGAAAEMGMPHIARMLMTVGIVLISAGVVLAIRCLVILRKE